MSDFENLPQDDIWSAFQLAFSPAEAIYFRNYPVRVDNSVREIDYFLYHRSGQIIIFLTDATEDEDLISHKLTVSSGITIQDRLSGEPRTYYPVEIARSFARAIRNTEIPYDFWTETVIIWMPNISIDFRDRYYSDESGDVIYLFGGVNSDQLASILQKTVADKDQSLIDDKLWLLIKGSLTPLSPIQSRILQSDQIEMAHKLSIMYSRRKSTLLFISYRRDDAGWPAGRIYGYLQSMFQGNIFFDYDSIKPGAHWSDAIDQALNDCIVQLVVMGPTWASITKPNSTLPRILEPKDMVAHEIRMAFRKKVTIIPIMIDQLAMPLLSQLPYGLKQLPTRNAMLINQDNFFAKMTVLTNRIVELLELALP